MYIVIGKNSSQMSKVLILKEAFLVRVGLISRILFLQIEKFDITKIWKNWHLK